MVWIPTRDLKHFGILRKAGQDLNLFEEKLEKFKKGDILLHNDINYKVLTNMKKVKISSLKKTEKVIYNELPNKKELDYMLRVVAI